MEMASTAALFVVVAVTVEALVEYAQTLLGHEKGRTLALQLASLAVGIALCCAAGADIYANLGVEFGPPYLGCVLTGVFASRGANFASDLVAKLNRA